MILSAAVLGGCAQAPAPAPAPSERTPSSLTVKIAEGKPEIYYFGLFMGEYAKMDRTAFDGDCRKTVDRVITLQTLQSYMNEKHLAQSDKMMNEHVFNDERIVECLNSDRGESAPGPATQ
jgi:hypothetical protein